MNKVDVDYEGMGTHVEAYIRANGKPVCTISSGSTDGNALTILIVGEVERFLKKHFCKKPKGLTSRRGKKT